MAETGLQPKAHRQQADPVCLSVPICRAHAGASRAALGCRTGRAGAPLRLLLCHCTCELLPRGLLGRKRSAGPGAAPGRQFPRRPRGGSAVPAPARGRRLHPRRARAPPQPPGRAALPAQGPGPRAVPKPRGRCGGPGRAGPGALHSRATHTRAT